MAGFFQIAKLAAPEVDRPSGGAKINASFQHLLGCTASEAASHEDLR
jgi:hypothetical protein